jgi:hypothetical protein
MGSSDPSSRSGRSTLDSAPGALGLKGQIARPDDSRPLIAAPVAVGNGVNGGGSHREVPQAVPRVEALDAKWQSAIDAATD